MPSSFKKLVRERMEATGESWQQAARFVRAQRKKQRPSMHAVASKDGAVSALQRQRQIFVDTFGREPLPHEPVFFDPDHTEYPIPLDMKKVVRQLADDMEAAGIDAAKVYAVRTTGIFPFGALEAEDIERLDAAVAAYNKGLN